MVELKNHIDYDVVIIGAGPAGLSASYVLSKNLKNCLVLEKDKYNVGGLSQTVKYKNYLFDLGGHRFYTKQKKVKQFWSEILEEKNFFIRKRLSRIFYRGIYFSYPLNIRETLIKVGLINFIIFGFSWLKAKFVPITSVISLEDWLTNRFGKKVYQHFFKSYTEKVWGCKASLISKDWADQRIQNLSGFKALIGNICRENKIKSLVSDFFYPRLGPGMMWEACAKKAQAFGCKFELGTEIISCSYGEKVWRIEYLLDNEKKTVRAAKVISTIPLPQFVNLINLFNKNDQIFNEINKLKYRDLIFVSVIYKDFDQSFPDNWIYIHDEDFKVGRIQNFKRWSEEMVPDINMACLGMEYFCSVGDDLWNRTDDDLVKIGWGELKKLKLVSNDERLIDFKVVRVEKAYPVYDLSYKKSLNVIKNSLQENVPGVYFSGRNSMHQYNNQDHSIMTSLVVADIILNKNTTNLDPWRVNINAEYIEELREDGSGA